MKRVPSATVSLTASLILRESTRVLTSAPDGTIGTILSFTIMTSLYLEPYSEIRR